jgi:ribosomal protein S27AE
MAVTRRTLIDNLDGISIRTYHRLIATGCQTVGELLALGPNLHTLIGAKAVRDLARELPAKWRTRVLEPPPPKPKPKREQVQRVRVFCTRCGHVSSVVTHRESEPCASCGGRVERRTKGRPRKQPGAV